MNTLEDNRTSVNLITVDHPKAFNRMSHQHCLLAFKTKGASHEDFTLYAGDTILFDVPSDESSAGYAIPFEQNGVSVELSPTANEDDFRPRSLSLPASNKQLGYSRSHYAELSSIGNEIATNTPI